MIVGCGGDNDGGDCDCGCDGVNGNGRGCGGGDGGGDRFLGAQRTANLSRSTRPPGGNPSLWK